MDKFRFLNWRVYKESKELTSYIIKIVKKLPKEYRFKLGSQIIRSSYSITLNIAEGSGKSSDRDMNHFFNIAHGSVYETLAAADVLRYNGFITQDEYQDIFNMLHSIGNQLGGFQKKLKKS